MPGQRGNKVPTLKEQRKSSSDKTFVIMREDISNFIRWGNMTLEVPKELQRDADERIGPRHGKGLVCRSTPYMRLLTSPMSGQCTPGQHIS